MNPWESQTTQMRKKHASPGQRKGGETLRGKEKGARWARRVNWQAEGVGGDGGRSAGERREISDVREQGGLLALTGHHLVKRPGRVRESSEEGNQSCAAFS